MNFLYSFEKLEAWIKAKELTKAIYKNSKSFPNDERFGLTLQFRRAAVSIVSNLAEGAGRKTPKDRANFYMIAYSSLLEVINQLILAHELGYIEENDYTELRKLAQETSYLINALHKSQKN